MIFNFHKVLEELFPLNNRMGLLQMHGQFSIFYLGIIYGFEVDIYTTYLTQQKKNSGYLYFTGTTILLKVQDLTTCATFILFIKELEN